jgi:protein-tyrosine phosphatase
MAVVMRPRGGKWLAADLKQLHAHGIRTLVSLLPKDEAIELGLAREGELAKEAGLKFLSFPMADHAVPRDTAAFRAFVISLAVQLWSHEPIGVHCQASIGRSTLVVACTLIHLGWEPAHALIDIANARRCPVPDTDEQQEWILRYEPES